MGCSASSGTTTTARQPLATGARHKNHHVPSVRSFHSGVYEVVAESEIEAGQSHRDDFGSRVHMQSSQAMIATTSQAVRGKAAGLSSPVSLNKAESPESGTDMSECPIGDRFREAMSTRARDDMSSGEGSVKDLHSGNSL